MTARALAYMFIFSVTTMSLLSLKRNPGNFWLMAGNRPELVYTWQEMLLIYPCTSLSSDTDAPRHVSPLILFPMESFTDAAFPLGGCWSSAPSLDSILLFLVLLSSPMESHL